MSRNDLLLSEKDMPGDGENRFLPPWSAPLVETREADPTFRGSSADIAKLARKLLMVSKSLEVKKSGWNKHLGKHYSTMADVMEALEKPLQDIGILPVPDVLLTERYAVEVATKNGPETLQSQDVLTRIQFIDCETGAMISLRSGGTGMDSRDKAAMIAQTNAYRTGLKSIFQIYDEEAAEAKSDRPEKSSQKATAAVPKQPEGEPPPCPKCKVPTEWKDGKYLCPTCHARVLA